MTWEGHSRTSTAAWKKLRPQILKRDRGICGICGTPGADTVDHKVPYSKGGTDHPDNLQAVHDDPCHRRKTALEGAAAKAKKYDRRRPTELHPGFRRPDDAA